jgi:hypothetical protein
MRPDSSEAVTNEERCSFAVGVGITTTVVDVVEAQSSVEVEVGVEPP